MAAIDKIYVTKEQFIKLERWYNMMVESDLMPDFMTFNQYRLDVDNWENPEEDKPVWNLSTKGDMWLLTNCPFDFVKKEIMSNYGFEDEFNTEKPPKTD